MKKHLHKIRYWMRNRLPKDDNFIKKFSIIFLPGNTAGQTPESSMPDSSQAAAAASAVQRPGFSSNARMRLLVYGLCFLTLLFLPIKMGATHGDKGPNYALPVIGYIESACIKQSSKTLDRKSVV